MNEQKENLKEGITLHTINTNYFKTNLYSVLMATPLDKKTVTLNALLVAVLRRGTVKFPTQELISKQLESMYGASFDCGIEKTGDNHILKFYLESISNAFLPEKENVDKQAMEMLLNIVFSPLVENNAFKKEYVESEKQHLKHIIEAKIDEKSKYAYERCMEEMFKNEPYGLYKYGYIEDLQEITPEELFDYYQKLIATCKIDIFASGTMQIEDTKNEIKQNENIQKIQARHPQYIKNNQKNKNLEQKQTKEVEEKMEVTQGKLVMGLSLQETSEQSKYIASVYNAILGGGANSKLFQNVREKNSLAYTVGSGYVRNKNTIFIRAGIEIQNKEKAMQTIEQQLQDMKNGNFTKEDMQSAKTLIISTIESIPSEQDAEITYYYSQEFSENLVSIEDYMEKIKAVTKEQIVAIANQIWVNTVYFLKGLENY